MFLSIGLKVKNILEQTKQYQHQQVDCGFHSSIQNMKLEHDTVCHECSNTMAILPMAGEHKLLAALWISIEIQWVPSTTESPAPDW